jgi:hypothetical protein
MSSTTPRRSLLYRIRGRLIVIRADLLKARDERRMRRQERRVLAELTARGGPRIQSGPFAGMEFTVDATWDHVSPLLLGSYEAELHEVIEDLARHDYTTIVNVGCAEGYYAVGLALRFPSARVYGFDIDPAALTVAAGVAERNQVGDRTTFRGECGPADLRRILDAATLLVVDCEGCEEHLLDPAVVPELRSADILVELHDFLTPKLTELVLQRFSDTHESQLIDAVPRPPLDENEYRQLSVEDRQWAVDERRPPGMQWAILRHRP